MRKSFCNVMYTKKELYTTNYDIRWYYVKLPFREKTHDIIYVLNEFSSMIYHRSFFSVEETFS